jgi:hypothetical protein
MSMYSAFGILTMMSYDILFIRVNFKMPIFVRLLIIVLWPLFIIPVLKNLL